jgi:hypothetical protein
MDAIGKQQPISSMMGAGAMQPAMGLAQAGPAQMNAAPNENAPIQAASKTEGGSQEEKLQHLLRMQEQMSQVQDK